MCLCAADSEGTEGRNQEKGNCRGTGPGECKKGELQAPGQGWALTAKALWPEEKQKIHVQRQPVARFDVGRADRLA